MEYGQQGGKKVTKETVVKTGKNLGKANETTVEEQCCADAESKWTKQRDRKGYTETIPTEVPYRPMLAKKYEDHAHKLKFPCYVQPKLDGVRCIFSDAGMMSRQGKVWGLLGHIHEEVKNLGLVTDGELYVHGWNFERVTAAVKRDEPNADTMSIEYHVYDIINDDKYDKRKTTLELAGALHNFDTDQKQPKYIKWVPTYIANSEDDIFSHMQTFLNLGYEGAIVRSSSGKYKMNGRSADLLKLKEFMDEEFMIVDVVEWDRVPGMAKFVHLHNGKQFESTPIGTEIQRREYFTNRDNYIGKMATVEFFEWTNTEQPVPRFPIAKCIRDYE